MDLRKALQSYMRAFAALYDSSHMKPKFHFAWHLPDMLSRLGWLPSCFVLERKHKNPKKYGNAVTDTSGLWDCGVLRDLSANHLQVLADLDGSYFGSEPMLLQPREAPPDLAQALRAQFTLNADTTVSISHDARANRYEHVSQGDIVLVRSAAGLVVGQIEVLVCLHDQHGESISIALLKQWDIQATQARAWKCSPGIVRMVACDLGDVAAALIWAGGDGIRTVLKPFRA